MGLFGSGPKDRAQLLAELSRMGPTDVDHLSAALAWPPHRTLRTLRSIPGGVRYDSSTGAVRPTAGPASTPTIAPAPSTPVPTGPVSPAGDLPVPGPCPACRTRMSSTGTVGTFYCESCGHLETRSTGTAAPPRRPDPSPPGRLDERRAQELIAAWVTSRPIPCPNCRRPLDHRGVQSYQCPACGEHVTFDDAGVTATR